MHIYTGEYTNTVYVVEITLLKMLVKQDTHVVMMAWLKRTQQQRRRSALCGTTASSASNTDADDAMLKGRGRAEKQDADGDEEKEGSYFSLVVFSPKSPSITLLIV